MTLTFLHREMGGVPAGPLTSGGHQSLLGPTECGGSDAHSFQGVIGQASPPTLSLSAPACSSLSSPPPDLPLSSSHHAVRSPKCGCSYHSPRFETQSEKAVRADRAGRDGATSQGSRDHQELEETGRVSPESLRRDHGPDDTLSSDLCPQTEQEHVSSGFRVCRNCRGGHRKLTPRITDPLGVRAEKDGVEPGSRGLPWEAGKVRS